MLDELFIEIFIKAPLEWLKTAQKTILRLLGKGLFVTWVSVTILYILGKLEISGDQYALLTAGLCGIGQYGSVKKKEIAIKPIKKEQFPL